MGIGFLLTAVVELKLLCMDRWKPDWDDRKFCCGINGVTFSDVGKVGRISRIVAISGIRGFGPGGAITAEGDVACVVAVSGRRLSATESRVVQRLGIESLGVRRRLKLGEEEVVELSDE